ncbi:hypothetical protein ABT86_11980 [Salmonella enterica subsp. enterica serovar Typhimurium]|nr:hypothetical protein ABT86_11980 [Salmonella enterica subsp. enterica serovar Typhimurium]
MNLQSCFNCLTLAHCFSSMYSESSTVLIVLEAISLLTVKVSDESRVLPKQVDYSIRPSIKKTPTEAGVPCPVQPTKANRT